MKRFNWKLAIATFVIIVVLDGILEFFSLAGPQDGRVWDRYLGIPFWIINFPGLPFMRYVGDASNGPTILLAVLAIVFFSALLWAGAAGYLLGRKTAPDESLYSTPR